MGSWRRIQPLVAHFLFELVTVPKKRPCRRRPGAGGRSPGVGELEAGEVEHPFTVGAVVVVHELLQLHLAVFLLGDIRHVDAPLRACGQGRGTVSGAGCAGEAAEQGWV